MILVTFWKASISVTAFVTLLGKLADSKYMIMSSKQQKVDSGLIWSNMFV